MLKYASSFAPSGFNVGGAVIGCRNTGTPASFGSVE